MATRHSDLTDEQMYAGLAMTVFGTTEEELHEALRGQALIDEARAHQVLIELATYLMSRHGIQSDWSGGELVVGASIKITAEVDGQQVILLMDGQRLSTTGDPDWLTDTTARIIARRRARPGRTPGTAA
ncbi:hypothetical protein LO762_27135 [Actinocorallia sp. API 0066]|uniref:hypothetical protein n=1 Tax=Actinocorallia sp. API 0066 TaxID=2896846 RepID=UPI001E393CEA|nr:hypothetical protein [Actinocorallia sp. API 0066]MCD0452829.1 hypothetical protein [Actinocorallia sp. API 0066]